MLNIPIPVVMRLKQSKNVLILGMGGGFDIFSGLPIYFTLEKMGVKCHLANFTHTPWDSVSNFVDPIPMADGCIGVDGNIKQSSANFPEAYLASWFRDYKQQDVKVWLFKRDQSVSQYSNSLNILVKHLGVDAILLVDGGVDSIMTGNEKKENLTKNFIETSIVLKSVENLKIDLFSVCCNNNVISSEEINNRIYNISSQGGFYGGCYIINYMKSYKDFKIFYDYYINSNDSYKEVENLVKNTDFEYEDNEIKNGQSQYLFFNSEALIYNNNAIKILEGDENYYDLVQKIAPFVNKY